MITRKESDAIVLEKLRQIENPNYPFAIDEDKTIEKPYGWIYFYNTKKYLETREYRFHLAGNGPLIVNKFTSALAEYGSDTTLEEDIQEYERTLPVDQRIAHTA